jgi:hypothetical protein
MENNDFEVHCELYNQLSSHGTRCSPLHFFSNLIHKSWFEIISVENSSRKFKDSETLSDLYSRAFTFVEFRLETGARVFAFVCVL